MEGKKKNMVNNSNMNVKELGIGDKNRKMGDNRMKKRKKEMMKIKVRKQKKTKEEQQASP